MLFGCSGGGGNGSDPAAPPATGEQPPTVPPPQPAPSDPPPAPPPATPTSGLDSRPSNATCLAWEKPTEGNQITLERFTQLTFAQPVGMTQAPNDPATWYVMEQEGVVRRFAANNPTSSSVFIDLQREVICCNEMGLLGMAFHPDYPRDPRVFFSYTANRGPSGSEPLHVRIASYVTRDNGATLDRSSEQIVLRIQKPINSAGQSYDNHNAGHIAFGPGGYLYMSVGDGGTRAGGGAEFGATAQQLTTMLGKVLRIDIDSASPYAIPPSNPFAQNPACPAAGRDSGACPEIYALGFRNPWRWSFDRSTGDLWLGDVGENRWEEVNRVVAGGNYGWRCREGKENYIATGCPTTGFTDPAIAYSHSVGRSVTGGYVYRGRQPTTFAGQYIYGDFFNGRIWAWDRDPVTAAQPTLLIESGLNISSFGEGNDGELYVIDYAGTLHRLVFQAGSGGGVVPESLRDTGCVSAADPTQPASGLIAYAINAPFWSDGAQKERWLALPDGQQIAVNADGDWDLPNRSVLVKSFRVGAQLVETRLLMRHPDGSWGGFTYEWNAQQTDAMRVRGGAVRDLGNGQSWIFPSEAQCLECHTAVTGRSLGLESAQFNRDLQYPQTGRTGNELFTLSHIGVLTPPVTDPAAAPSMPDPANTGALLDQRARAWLHTNCSQCHRPGGPTPSNMDLRYTTALGATNTCNTQPQSGDLGLGANARLIAPGDAAHSIVVNRPGRRDEHGMPPLASSQVDTAGVALLTEWVNSLTGC